MAAMASGGALRPYEAADLMSLKRSELLEIVEKQRSRWPDNIPLNSKTNKTQLRDVLLNQHYGFKTAEPRTAQSGSISNFVDCDPFAQLVEQLQPPQPAASASAPPPPAPQPQVRGEGQYRLPPFENNDNEQHFLHIYVEDDRFTPTFRSSADIVIGVESTLHGDMGSNVWYATSRAIVAKLQESHCRIIGPGPIRIGTADLLNPNFTQFFVEALATDLATAPMNPSLLAIPESPTPTLTLRVTGQHIDHFETQQFQRIAAPNARRSLRLTPEEVKLIVKRLIAIASLRTEYRKLPSSKNVVLQNADIAELWHFVTQFWEDFHKKDCEMVLGEAAWAGKLITAECIYGALEIQSSAVHQAIEGDRLVQRYIGIGENFDAEVVKEIATKRDPPLGRQKLLDFLRRRENMPS